MKQFLFVILLLNVFIVNAQNPEGFDSNCKKYITGSIPLVYPSQLYSVIKSPNTVVLDARGKSEFEVSHIYKAQYVGYEKFNINNIGEVSKSDSIYIYCSIGYRSEKIGEQLKKQGYKNVFNLYGGIFNWVNSGYKVIDKENNQTKNVHGYDKEWSKMLNSKKSSVVLNK